MKSYLTYAVAILIATMAVATAAPDTDALMQKENAAWQAFKDKNADAFKKIVSANMTAVYAEGLYDTQKEVDSMAKWDIKSFAISDYKVNSPGIERRHRDLHSDAGWHLQWEGRLRHLQCQHRLVQKEWRRMAGHFSHKRENRSDQVIRDVH